MPRARSFRDEIQAAIAERHCANHPLTEKWARGELSRNAMMGWAIEHYHWTSNIWEGFFYRVAKAPRDVQLRMLEVWLEEHDPERPHLPIVLRFAAANGANIDEVQASRGLPTTEAWVAWSRRVQKDEHFIAGTAHQVATESQSPTIYGKILPALRSIYRFPEDAIEHFWLHVEADDRHGDTALRILEAHCTTPELREMAIHFARESARMRWLYFDGIYLHYEIGYALR